MPARTHPAVRSGPGVLAVQREKHAPIEKQVRALEAAAMI